MSRNFTFKDSLKDCLQLYYTWVSRDIHISNIKILLLLKELLFSQKFILIILTNITFKSSPLSRLLLKVGLKVLVDINLFIADLPILYPLKTPENHWLKGKRSPVYYGAKQDAIVFPIKETPFWGQVLSACSFIMMV